jgi:hypothetical protein
MDDSFDLAIKDHLELQRRNRLLEPEMPLATYREGGTPAPAPATRAAIALEDTQEWVLPEVRTVIDHEPEPLFPPPEELWSGTPAFDWGD